MTPFFDVQTQLQKHQLRLDAHDQQLELLRNHLQLSPTAQSLVSSENLLVMLTDIWERLPEADRDRFLLEVVSHAERIRMLEGMRDDEGAGFEMGHLRPRARGQQAPPPGSAAAYLNWRQTEEKP